jgi:hypothetical protein
MKIYIIGKKTVEESIKKIKLIIMLYNIKNVWK